MKPARRRQQQRLQLPLGSAPGAPVASIVAPLELDGRGFAPVRLQAAPPTPRLLADLAVSLTRARERGAQLAVQAFCAPSPRGDRRSLTFVLAAALADVPYPDAEQLDQGGARAVELECGPATRLWSMRSIDAGQLGGGELPVFSVTYLCKTDLGVLALAFVTPHVDGAGEFSLLFHTIARTCRLTAEAS